MNPIPADLSERALIHVIRANLCEFFRHISQSLPERLEDEKFTRWQTGVMHPWFNGVLSAQPAAESDKAFIEETISYFRDRNVGRFSWWIGPRLQRQDWEPALAPYGFSFSDDTPGMAADLHVLREPTPTVHGLEIHVVADEETLRTWTHVFVCGYGLPEDWEPAAYDLMKTLGLGFPIRNYLGTLNGEPVATSSLFFGAGVGGVYDVATLPSARGQGIGAALTRRAMQNARELGYRVAVLQSSKMGFNLYQKIGFRHLCQIEHFELALD